MIARVQILRDDGTVIIEVGFASFELGEPHTWKTHPAGGPMLEHGMLVSGFGIQARVRPAALADDAGPDSGTCLYRCPQCGEVWRGPVRPGPTYKHFHEGRPEQYLEPFDDDGRAVDETHDLRMGVWMA